MKQKVYTVMVNIPTITAKSTITSRIKHRSYKKVPRHMALEIQVLPSDMHTNVAGLNQLMRSQTSQIDHCIFNDNTKYKCVRARSLVFCVVFCKSLFVVLFLFPRFSRKSGVRFFCIGICFKGLNF
jgi:hypothetical protein